MPIRIAARSLSILVSPQLIKENGMALPNIEITKNGIHCYHSCGNSIFLYLIYDHRNMPAIQSLNAAMLKGGIDETPILINAKEEPQIADNKKSKIRGENFLFISSCVVSKNKLSCC